MIKTCLFCKEFYLSTGSPGYSDMTPGYGAELRCEKDVWEIDLLEDSTETYREKMITAQTCNLFDLVELPWLDKPVIFAKGVTDESD